MALVVAGTGTDVGKTLFSALVMAKYANTYGIRYFKPIQTGEADDAATVQLIAELSNTQVLPQVYRFPVGASPHFAAELAGNEIDPVTVLRAIRAVPPNTLIELAGGLMVPLTRAYTNLDLIAALDFPVALVASTALGTINHSLLSHAALQRAKVRIAGIYFVGVHDQVREDNMRTVIEMTGAVNLGNLLLPAEIISAATLRATAKDFDPKGKLGGYFR
jgi:dethiobiotin synthetase